MESRSVVLIRRFKLRPVCEKLDEDYISCVGHMAETQRDESKNGNVKQGGHAALVV